MRKLRHRNRRKNKQRKIIIISACSLLLFMTVGYAAMNTNLEINAKGNVIKKATLGEDLIELAGVVTSGDGLYKDTYEENVYTYRGANPNNYVTFNEESWRIISINISDNTIKIIRDTVLPESMRFSNDSTCSIVYNDVRKTNETYIVDNINYLAPDTGLVGCNKWNEPVELNEYLNNEYYNELEGDAKNMIKEDAIYKIGELNYDNSNITIDMEQVSSTKWKGKVGLIDATEYVRASTNSNCTNITAYDNNSSCYNNSSSHNWMYLNDGWWTLSPYSFDNASIVWDVSSGLGYNNAHYWNNVRPVITLSPDVKITSGDGSQNNSYQLSI